MSFPSSLKTTPHPRAGFSLIELLTVLAIIAVLIGLTVPAFVGLLRSGQLTQAGQTIHGKLKYARQVAVSANREVEIRFFTLPNSAAYTGCQAYVSDESGTTFTPLEKPTFLPASIIFDSQANSSTILDNAPTTGTLNILSLGNNINYKGFMFRPDGSTNLSATGPKNNGAETWFVTLCSEFDKATPPRNYYTLQIEPLSGAITEFRP